MARPPPSPHKPRRRPRLDQGKLSKSEALVRAPAFPLASFLWPARSSVSQWEVLPLILMVAGLFRWAAGLWGYSGFHRPPLFGDYEAQRHWMEITAHLPISHWICGKIGNIINPAWFALFTSRGSDDPTLKIFMRATVIVSEYLIFIPATVIFVRRYSRLNGVSAWSMSLALTAFLMQPATILIDHVHFQYNTVMLGFVLASMSSLLAERYMWAAVFFVAALGFKQMALYYAFAIFSYLLGSCVTPMVHRVFPFARGLFEDKVANFWCIPRDDPRRHHPPNLILFLRPNKTLLPLGFAATAWGFFLFSYQVHEKSVLLPLMPMTLLLAGKHGMSKDTRAWVGFANILGCWTMYPLLSRVDLRVPYAVLTFLWAYLLGLPPTSVGVYFSDLPQSAWLKWGTRITHLAFYAAMAVWHAVNAFVQTPPSKPDLWVVANVGIGAAGFLICYVWCVARLAVDSGLLNKTPKTKTQ
ncbi:unnamed protein product [Parascedosporium putredinis]|uniref:Alpha-1,3-glucosyltransferase n=1 Tax=Parascedosporium putredinis TaxID=1442378 RepID=A0A9P1M9V4_9PEZI|nr:unnamed protein product [Parascedosporium putredinis]CAI7992784.1 unnamed protein product [Parascedosporium putredinis]